MYTERFTYPGAGGLAVTAYRWDPATPPSGAVQLTHGMGEHVLRYDETALALTAAGYVVYGQDHRGHGNTAAAEDQLGQLGPDGWHHLVEDIGRLSELIREERPGLPLAVLAHSMGSFATQQYLLEHSDQLDAVVLTGTALLDLLEPALDLDQELDLAMFNAPFQPARTEFEWLTRDEKIVDAYLADPHCGFGLDRDSVKAMFADARRLAAPDALTAIRPSLPVYIAVGEQDPVNGQLALVKPLADRYRAAGLTDVTLVTYPGARHEILNETNRADVIAELLTWLDRKITLPGWDAAPADHGETAESARTTP
ncbi:alpha/beta fold hydrolase [Amycolatopsis saalfeldensis]|uniref:Lysophospholipase, alpha-beta hydrolase superfamily n=1 Tax=Amycolatopsis saalfeldensis TaxID=394193 RepID=A0A1H8Y903_9PSEU|nr:alpha/beta hydrolase [Amycolatopsis saalfeldensis]SEP48754.1 Lysophospholipase, alpha-beta hydrolase superfamily [Amycolatopsis saalfeldensis]